MGLIPQLDHAALSNLVLCVGNTLPYGSSEPCGRSRTGFTNLLYIEETKARSFYKKELWIKYYILYLFTLAVALSWLRVVHILARSSSPRYPPIIRRCLVAMILNSRVCTGRLTLHGHWRWVPFKSLAAWPHSQKSDVSSWSLFKF
jgi:hypothetical protein